MKSKMWILTLMLCFATSTRADEVADLESLRKIVALQQAQIEELKRAVAGVSSDSSRYVTKTEAESFASKVSIENFATKEEVSSAIGAGNFATKDELAGATNSVIRCNQRISLNTSSGNYNISTTSDADIVKAVAVNNASARQILMVICR